VCYIFLIMLELHEEIRRARKDLGLSQSQLCALCGVQRRQLSTLERGGNVTLATLRKVIGFLPNLQDFTFEQVRMKPTYVDLPPFEWQAFYANMTQFGETLDGIKTSLDEWLANPPAKEVDPELLTRRTTNLATDILKQFVKLTRQESANRRKAARTGKEPAE
jgi:transcriptional regulator with XRE-family HTH domain